MWITLNIVSLQFIITLGSHHPLRYGPHHNHLKALTWTEIHPDLIWYNRLVSCPFASFLIFLECDYIGFISMANGCKDTQRVRSIHWNHTISSLCYDGIITWLWWVYLSTVQCFFGLWSTDSRCSNHQIQIEASFAPIERCLFSHISVLTSWVWPKASCRVNVIHCADGDTSNNEFIADWLVSKSHSMQQQSVKVDRGVNVWRLLRESNHWKWTIVWCVLIPFKCSYHQLCDHSSYRYYRRHSWFLWPFSKDWSWSLCVWIVSAHR